jgi:DNA replication protein DnaC
MTPDLLIERAQRLHFYGLIEHCDEVQNKDWVETLLQWEEDARHQRSFERRRSTAHIEKFKPLALFDWGWPIQCDRDAIEGWMRLNFIKDAINPILCGPNGIGKTMIARNVAYEALKHGHTVHFTTASQMLDRLERVDSDRLLRQRIKYYIHPTLLVIAGIGMLSYTTRHADLLFEVIHHRYEKKPTFITMTKSFSEWRDVFPNASSVVSIIDRLVHHSKIVTLDGPSFRLKEANINVLSSPNQEKL